MMFQVLVDYAHTHDSLENVLQAIRTAMPHGKLICVFGCGGDRDRTKRPKMAAVAEKLADKVFVTSDNPRTEDPAAIIAEIRTGFSPNANGKITIDPDRRAPSAPRSPPPKMAMWLSSQARGMRITRSSARPSTISTMSKKRRPL